MADSIQDHFTPYAAQLEYTDAWKSAILEASTEVTVNVPVSLSKVCTIGHAQVSSIQSRFMQLFSSCSYSRFTQ